MVESFFDKGIFIVVYEKCLEFKKELNYFKGVIKWKIVLLLLKVLIKWLRLKKL